MRELKLYRIQEKVNVWLKCHNYNYKVAPYQTGYKQQLFQGPHEFKFQLTRADSFDAHYAKTIMDFVFEAMQRDFYESIFGKVIRVRLDVIPLTEHPQEYLKKHKFNVIGYQPNPIGDCWILDIIDEGLPLTKEMTII